MAWHLGEMAANLQATVSDQQTTKQVVYGETSTAFVVAIVPLKVSVL